MNSRAFVLYYKKECGQLASKAAMQQSRRLKIAGLLLIIMGSIGILVTLLLTLILWAVAEGLAVGFGNPANVSPLIMWLFGLIAAIPGMISVLGGVSAWQKRRWKLALAGAICAFLYFNVLGVPALVFLILGKNEFGKKGALNTKNG